MLGRVLAVLGVSLSGGACVKESPARSTTRPVSPIHETVRHAADANQRKSHLAAHPLRHIAKPNDKEGSQSGTQKQVCLQTRTCDVSMRAFVCK